MTPRDHATDIAALATSGHVEVGGALQPGERVQTSGRGEPDVRRLSGPAERAARILGRGYSHADTSRYAIALVIAYAYPRPLSMLELAAALTLTEPERLARAREWTKWGEGPASKRLTAEGTELIGRAIGWYQTASEEPGYAGAIGLLWTQVDAAHGAIKRMHEEHNRALAAVRRAAKGGKR